MKLLITGGLGYVGARLAASLATDPGIELTLTSRRAGAAAPFAPRARVETVASYDDLTLARLCRDVDAIVHLAGMNAAQCRRAGEAAVIERVAATSALLRAGELCGVRRFVYLSTAHVYGAALTGGVDESTVPAPVHPYGASHLAAEAAVRDAGGGIDRIVARLSNAFGAPASADSDCWPLVANDLARQAVVARRMTLRTAGRQRRDFVAMNDVCRVLRFFCDAPRRSGGVRTFNVGGADAPTLLEFAQRIAGRVESQLGFSPAIETGTVEDTVGAGPLDYRIDRLRAAGFEPAPDAALYELDRLIGHCASRP